ncbi:GAF domain-containing protein [Nostoc sp. JL31]|uniref:GAF domain-containing protein n=1 Tax=Nostoc sp. JL31 TaxID=2815395 RepID=UPI0025D904CB|nr:GAF domain-containing protein [Nostoc sp. JL31]
MATSETTQLYSEPMEENLSIPVKLIQYVKNTQEMVVIDRLKTDLPVIDEYLTQQQPQSFLCLPILHQGNLIGILYLQNRSTSGVFTSEAIAFSFSTSFAPKLPFLWKMLDCISKSPTILKTWKQK